MGQVYTAVCSVCHATICCGWGCWRGTWTLGSAVWKGHKRCFGERILGFRYLEVINSSSEQLLFPSSSESDKFMYFLFWPNPLLGTTERDHCFWPPATLELGSEWLVAILLNIHPTASLPWEWVREYVSSLTTENNQAPPGSCSSTRHQRGKKRG